MGQHDGTTTPYGRPPVSSGPVEPYLTNNRIISQILQPASLPSPEPGNNNFDSPLTEQRVSNHGAFPSPGINPGFGNHGNFQQPSISHLAGPSQHPNMEMLLQAVSTSHWTDAMQGKQDFSNPPPARATSQSVPPQVPTGFINLGLPSTSASGDLVTGGDMADVFGWGVNGADWMKLYDSIGVETILSSELPGTYGLVDSFAAQDGASGSPLWATHQSSSTIPAETSGTRRLPLERYQGDEPRGSYSLPSELPDYQEVYLSRTSRINRDMTYVSAVNHDSGSMGPSTSALKHTGERTVQGASWVCQQAIERSRSLISTKSQRNPAPIPVKKVLALPHSVNLSSASEYPAYVGSRHHASLLRLINLTHEPTFSPPDLANFPDPGVMSTCVGLYFEHFHPILPVLRPAAFEDLGRYLNQDTAGTATSNAPASNIVEYQSHPYYPFLLLTMCAIGATYGKRDWKPVAIYMNELARRAGKHLVCPRASGRPMLTFV